MLALLISNGTGLAQIPTQPTKDQQALLQSDDPKLARNKKLVYDCWREVLEARHLDLAKKFMKADYIQHNPNAKTGRDGFVKYFSKFGEPKPINPTIQMPLINIVAEGDIVVLSFVRNVEDPDDPSKRYSTTWFDMFRIEDGKIAEHWDCAMKQE